MQIAPSSEQDIRAALDRVAAGEEFRASPNLTAFLRFIVERTLEGREDSIKAYTVATEVLGRPTSFDPQVDPIVRVEATRLRRNLERYYARTGDSFLITIPRGSYVPQFGPADPMAEPAAVAVPADIRPSELVASAPTAVRRRKSFAILGRAAAAVLLVLCGAGLALYGLPLLQTQLAKPPREPAPTLAALTTADPSPVLGRPRAALSLTAFGTVLVAPLQPATTTAKVHADIVTDLLRDALARFDDIVVVEVPSEQPTSLPAPSDDTYLLTGRLTRLGGTSKIALRLRHEVSQQIVWSGEYLLAVGDGPGLSDTAMLRKVATALASPTGVIAGDPAAAKRKADPMTVPAACFMEAGAFVDPSRQDRLDLVTACLQRAVADYPRLSSGWALLARTNLERFRIGGSGDEGLLSQALSQAITARAVAPQSARASQILSDILAARGDVRGAGQAIERSLELNPNSADALQSLAFRRIEAGDYASGLGRLNEVEDAGAPPNPWRTLYMALALSGTPGNVERLSRVQDPAAHPAAILSVMIATASTAQSEAARQAFGRLSTQFPGIAGDPAGFLRRIGLRDLAAQGVVNGLAAAQLASSKS